MKNKNLIKAINNNDNSKIMNLITGLMKIQ